MLCNNCQNWINTIKVKSHQEPYLHCHHEEAVIDYQKPWRKAVQIMVNWPGHEEPPEEPKIEYPKDKCWCQSPSWRKYVLSEIKWTAIYCPLCRRRL